jgi:hypothetical protein
LISRSFKAPTVFKCLTCLFDNLNDGNIIIRRQIELFGNNSDIYILFQ